MELVNGSDKTHNTDTTTEHSADCGNLKAQHEASIRIDSITSEERLHKRPQQAANPPSYDQVDLESGLPHPGLRVDSAVAALAQDDESVAKIGAMREPIVSRPPRVFQTSIGEELDSKKGHPHPGTRIPTPGVREEKKDQYIADMPSPRIERAEGVLTPWPEEQKFSPWGYDTELTNMDTIHKSRSPGPPTEHTAVRE